MGTKRSRLIQSAIIRLPSCGYALHIQELDSDAYEDIVTTPAPFPPNADDKTKAKINLRNNTEAALSMIRKVSTIPVKTAEAANALKEDEWEEVTLQEMLSVSSDSYYENWMGPKDRSALRLWFQQFHSITEDTMEKVMGKAIPVSPV